MAVIGSAMKREGVRSWMQRTQNAAKGLLAHAEALSESVFSSPETLVSFLDLTARQHHFCAVNLLLIWESYPSARWLAGFKVWEKKLPPGTQILKEDQKGKGIHLVAPFTDVSDPQNRLVWYEVIVFDVSQTTVTVSPPAFDPGYILDDAHEDYLMQAITKALGSKFNKSVIVRRPTQFLKDVGLPGQISEDVVSVRDDISRPEQLQWLTEVLAQVATESAGFDPPAAQLMRDCIRYCLLRIWSLDQYLRPPTSTMQLASVAPRQMEFLHLLRDSVRDLNNLVCSCYQSEREEEDDLDIDLDLLQTL